MMRLYGVLILILLSSCNSPEAKQTESSENIPSKPKPPERFSGIYNSLPDLPIPSIVSLDSIEKYEKTYVNVFDDALDYYPANLEIRLSMNIGAFAKTKVSANEIAIWYYVTGRRESQPGLREVICILYDADSIPVDHYRFAANENGEVYSKILRPDYCNRVTIDTLNTLTVSIVGVDVDFKRFQAHGERSQSFGMAGSARSDATLFINSRIDSLDANFR
jgi:hypothetical protein